MSEDDVYKRFAANLERTERMSRSGLTTYRDGLLARLLSFARTQSPFYRDRLEQLFRTTDVPNLRAWHEVPILRRNDLERDIDRINPAERPADIGEVTTRRTSGTTGVGGMTFRICALVRIADACMMQRLYRWWGYDDTAPMASVRRPALHYSLDLRTQFQIRQPGPETIELLYVPAGATPADRTGLCAYFEALLGRSIKLVLTATDAIPRTPGGKHERIVSAVAD
jgi:phenylacetate-coenzyme A ligase PaaK-like adenylate-forming protein